MTTVGSRVGYVPAIDGLRAIAIAAVMLFHLRPAWLPGGLGGVDLFFVISGFVVTASLLRRPAEPPRALALGFFARRIVRIVPALVAMLLVASLATVLFIPLAGDMTLTRGTGVAATAGVANIFLAIWDDAYLARNTGLNPLLHSWTLGVEEQFYLIFPLLFALRPKWPRAFVAGVVLLSGLSVLLCAVVSPAYAKFSFYLMPTRFWELGAGVLLALTLDRWSRIIPGRMATAGALLCGALLTFCFHRNALFPVPGALPIVAASIGLIALAWSHPASVASRALSLPPALYVGRLSYSLYLWHWPVFVLLGWTIGLEGWANALGAVALSFVLAAASYHLIEQPIRRVARAGPSPQRIIVIGLATLLGCALAITAMFSAAPALTLSRNGQRDMDDTLAMSPGCTMAKTESRFTRGLQLGWTRHCATRGISPRLFVVGDSHARAWASAMPLYAAQTGATVTMLTHPGCDFPALSRPMARKPQCARFYADASAFLLRTLKPGDILFLPSLRIPARAEDAAKGPPLLPGAKPEYLALSRRLVATGARLVIEAPTPVFDSPPFRCLDAFNRHNPVCRAGFEVDRSAMEKARQSVLGRMHRLAGDVAGVEIWDPLPILCPGVRCSALRDGRPLYLDTNHLNYRGHMLLYSSLRAMLRLDDAVSKRGRQ